METLRIAIAALQRHKLRSFLTLLGVIIGVMTVVAVVSVISGLNAYVSEKLFQLNPDVFIVTQFGIITSRDEFLEALKRKKLDMADVEAVKQHCTHCDDVAAGIQSNMPVKRGAQRLRNVTTYGVTPNLAEINNLDIEAGRFFTDTENHHSAPVAVIGSDVRDELFANLDPIGRTVWLNGKPLKVIGLLRKQGSVLGQSQDSQLYLPLSTFRKNFGQRRSMAMFVRAKGGVPGVAAAEDDIRVIIRSRRHTPFHDKDPFGLVSAESLQAVWRNISAGAFALMTFISGISLAVGGIVIMNIMLVSVVERTREIGIRRAIGARKRDIMLQFLTEAVLLSFLGGFVGVLLGVGISKGLSMAFPLPTRVTPTIIIVGLLIAVVTGVAAGIFPARKAAKLPPVEALRWE